MNNKLIPLLAFILTTFPSVTYAQTQTGLGEVSNFGELISLVWSYGSQVIIALAVFLIVLGAFFYVGSGGDEKRISDGKQMIIGSLIGILIVIFSGVLIRTLHRPADGTTGQLTEIPTVINNATNILIALIAAFTVAMLIYAGFLYATAAGDSDKVHRANLSLRYSVIGLVIGVLAFVITNNIISAFI